MRLSVAEKFECRFGAPYVREFWGYCESRVITGKYAARRQENRFVGKFRPECLKKRLTDFVLEGRMCLWTGSKEVGMRRPDQQVEHLRTAATHALTARQADPLVAVAIDLSVIGKGSSVGCDPESG